MALSVDNHLPRILGDQGSRPIAADVKIYEGSALGDLAGNARPLTAGDRFIGHSIFQVDNTGGAAGAKNVQHLSGRYRLIVPLAAAVTDVGQPVYASDDGTYSLVAVANSFVGRLVRRVSTTHVEVEFMPGETDDFGANAARQTKADNYTITAADSGRITYVTADAKTITLPATVAGLTVTIVNGGADGAVAVTVAPNAADKIQGMGLTAADNKAIVNTKATAKRGDFIELVADGTDGWMVKSVRGIWARQT